ncbi:Rrf2 family transcriptional regulator [Oenococcus oeni]|uniref:Transcriptional regulator n=1 Tax=Oenococcus oeni TaxID=1247 RepID=A0A6N4A6H5_OENOE|nr:Rrf2 family transcriptional regulator [Oenococcus oeni]AVI93881.1 Rrf2 family transcriptional regulator [Oenococcus oeni]KGH96424.1 Rrf2 family transcriptional regulator [Oenococcus oeni IOEB_S450]KGI01362.1 Rrf2 family transcriptional regulator [Oenococcus oeni IOEB_C52]KZD13294.1 Rrf2 family transcriptional regulator, group III [Oenococcus oeni]MDV7687289.1 transcriptional regulator [Oenococcus oeni]
MANTQLSDATHVLVYIALHKNKQSVKSSEIAVSLQTAPSLVRRIMSKLKKAHLLNAVQGSPQPVLAKAAEQITLQEIYLAVSQKRNLLNVDQNTDMLCPIGTAIPKVLDHYYREIQTAAEMKMAEITLQDIINDTKAREKQFDSIK